jgi:hypothetical protein
MTKNGMFLTVFALSKTVSYVRNVKIAKKVRKSIIFCQFQPHFMKLNYILKKVGRASSGNLFFERSRESSEVFDFVYPWAALGVFGLPWEKIVNTIFNAHFFTKK